MNIKLVTFDLWETLLFEHDGDNQKRLFSRSINLAKCLQKFGITVSKEQLLPVIKAMAPWLKEVWEINRDVTHQEQLQFIVNQVTQGLVEMKKEWIDDLSSAYISPLFEIPPYLSPGARKALCWLKDLKIFMGIICNTGRTPGFGIRRFLIKEGIADFFDFMLFSDEIGIRKPDPQIFRLAIEKVNVRTCESVHIGDNLKSDIWGAQNAGFKAIYLSTEIGQDKFAESDPSSLVSFSRGLGSLKEKNIIPDWTVSSLSKVVKIIGP